jgi:hypothetical protein
MAIEVVDRVPVRFHGEGSGVEKLTWGQMSMWQSIVVSGQSRTVSGLTELPAGITVDDIAESLRYAVSRHQALRTRLRFVGTSGQPGSAEYPMQVCSADGELFLDVVDAGDDDPAEVARAVLDRSQTTHFDYEHEWPLRAAVVRKDGALTHMVAVYLHLSIDAGGLEALIADGAARPRDGSDAPPVTATQPLDQARWQWSPAGQRHTRAAQRYLEHVLRTVPMSRFGEPRDDGPPRFRKIRYTSPATLLAAQAAAVRSQTNTSSVLLAGFAVAVARVAGRNPVMAMLTVSNRFRPRLAESVSTLAQVAPYLIDVADTTIGDAVRRAAQSTLNCYKNAYFDPDQHDTVYHRIFAERGQIDLSCYYNDRRQRTIELPTGSPPTAAEITEALARTTYEWVDDPEMPASKLYLYVADPPGAVEFQLSVDLRYLSEDDLLALVREMESVAVAAALEPTAATGVSAPATVPA